MALTQRRLRLLISDVILLLLVAGGWWHLKHRNAAPQATPATRPATQPTAQTIATPADLPPRTYFDLIRKAYPSFPTTQPLDESMGLQYAGHFTLPDPVYLDATGRLWITRADAEATEVVLPKAAEQQVILTRERPAYVHWISTDTGELPYLICLNSKATGYEVVTAADRQPIGKGTHYDWARARAWDERIVVPTDVGISVFKLGRRAIESVSPPLATPTETHAPVQITFSNGPLAWIPPQPGHPGSKGAVRFTNGVWSTLTPENGWPAGLIHLIPLLDGSVLQLLAGQNDLVKLGIVSLDPMNPSEEKKIQLLVSQLSDSDAATRTKAYQELTRYGAGLWTVAEKLMPTESPETQARLRDLIKSKMSPLLGGMQLVDSKMRVLSRYPDGGILFYAEAGVQIPRGNDQPLTIAPAWLSALPGESIRLLSPDLVQDLNPARVHLAPYFTEWIVTDKVRGPQRLLGGDLIPLLRKSERPYSQLVGIARGGRYVFRKPSTSSTTQPDIPSDGPVLVIDPRLPDPKPRLPVWQIEYPQSATVGWDKNDWPGAKQRAGWALGANDWRVLDSDTEQFYSSADQVPAWPPLPATHPARVATTQPARPGNELDGKPILVDSERTYYFDGRKSLVAAKPDGKLLRWPLPAQAVGEGDVFLVRTRDGLLFLFNQPGRVVRIRPTPGAPEPFALDAIFSDKIPKAEHPTRIWLDPFGRIDMAFDQNKLAILFPQGYIPPAMASLIPAEDQDDWLNE
jgi:hypothetical protein